MSKVNFLNGVDRQKLFGTIEAVKADNAVANFQFRLFNQWVDGGENRSRIDDYFGAREEMRHAKPFFLVNDEPSVLLSGDKAPEEILASVENGIFAMQFGGGQVDITSGKFTFSCTEAYRIEKGNLAAPLKGATLIGSGPDVLKKVTMIGNDSALDNGVGTCGKDGQSVPVGVGQPTLRIDGITVGGTEARG